MMTASFETASFDFASLRSGRTDGGMLIPVSPEPFDGARNKHNEAGLIVRAEHGEAKPPVCPERSEAKPSVRPERSEAKSKDAHFLGGQPARQS